MFNSLDVFLNTLEAENNQYEPDVNPFWLQCSVLLVRKLSCGVSIVFSLLWSFFGLVNPKFCLDILWTCSDFQHVFWKELVYVQVPRVYFIWTYENSYMLSNASLLMSNIFVDYSFFVF